MAISQEQLATFRAVIAGRDRNDVLCAAPQLLEFVETLNAECARLSSRLEALRSEVAGAASALSTRDCPACHHEDARALLRRLERII